MHRYALSLVVLLAVGYPDVYSQSDPARNIEFFEKSIRPLLTNHCLECHGPSANKGGLRLHTREDVLRGGDRGEVMVVKEPAKSRLLKAIRHLGDLKMPPEKKLADAEIAAMEKWITLGAPWSDQVKLVPHAQVKEAAKKHWAFQPIRKPSLPTVRKGADAQTPIDAFVMAKLEAAGLSLSPQADRRTLIRRATLDLHGVPPTFDEVVVFENDPSPDAYAKVIDRLLASPRYGERWGRHWLDLARYADNKGYVFFEDKNYPWAYTYRDYVIDALNRDVGFDRFVREQLAADLLPNSDSKSLAALGFLTLGGHFMNNTHDIIDDRIDVVTRGLLGLTVTCARCHDHKFDPVPQADYYSLYGIFRSCYEPTVPPLWGNPPETEQYRTFAKDLAEREKKLIDFVTAKHRELVTQARTRAGEYLFAAYLARNQPPADDFMLLADKGDLNPTMITRWKVFLEESRKPRDPAWIPWHRFADIPEGEFASRSDPVLTELAKESAISPRIRKAFSDKPKSMKEVAERYGKLLVDVEKEWQTAINFAAKEKQPPPAKLLDAESEALRAVLYGPRSPADAPLALDWGFLSLFPDRATQGEYQKLLKEVESFSVKGPPRAMVLLDSQRPHEPRIFGRGHPNRLGEYVPRQMIEVVDTGRKPFAQGSGRRELAEAILAPGNPLTARVLVNRVWMHHFAKPLVSTPSDFGLRSDPPTHPELLDHLAIEFREQGWSIKSLHRRIMLSAVYQQSSKDREAGIAADPENRLLWKMNRRGLEFEAIHDSLLVVSGSLDSTLGGPSFPLFTGKTRRAVYGHIDRLEFPSLLNTFDVPNPATTSPQRIPTIVAPQALYLMNGPFARDAARRLIAVVNRKPASTTDQRIDMLFEMVFQRQPKESERTVALRYLGAKPTAERWLDLAHGLLMTNEFAVVD